MAFTIIKQKKIKEVTDIIASKDTLLLRLISCEVDTITVNKDTDQENALF